MGNLYLSVGPIPGSDISNVFADASSLAAKLNLAWVEFRFNDDDCTAYPDYRGHIYREHKPVGKWTDTNGIQWEE